MQNKIPQTIPANFCWTKPFPLLAPLRWSNFFPFCWTFTHRLRSYFFNLSCSLRPQTMASGASEPQSENLADFDWNCLLSKLLYYANANVKFLDESFYSNNHIYTGERYLNLDICICNHKSWMSSWAEIIDISVAEILYDSCSQKLRGKFHQNAWTCLDYTSCWLTVISSITSSFSILLQPLDIVTCIHYQPGDRLLTSHSNSCYK